MSRSSRSSSRARPPRPTPRAEAGKHRASGAGDQLARLVPWGRCCGSVRCSMTAARRGLGDRGVRRRFRRRGGRVRVRARVELGVPRRGRLPAAGPPAALGGAAGLGIRRTRLRHRGVHRSRVGTTDARVRRPSRGGHRAPEGPITPGRARRSAHSPTGSGTARPPAGGAPAPGLPVPTAAGGRDDGRAFDTTKADQG
jgi:hypothetical protein